MKLNVTNSFLQNVGQRNWDLQPEIIKSEPQ